MSDEQKNETKSVATAKVPAVTLLLESVALEIYKSMSASGYRGKSPDAVAGEAFARADVFAREAMRIRDGGKIAEIEQEKPSPKVMVVLWDALNTGPLVDDETGKEVVVEMLGDKDSCAPNLPEGHPINQRYWKARHIMGLPIDNQKFDRAAKEWAAREKVSNRN